jgi:hypothetical protein
MSQAFRYDKTELEKLLFSIIERNSTSQAKDWLLEQQRKLEETGALQRFNLTFTAIPRFVGKTTIELTAADITALNIIPGLFIQGYTLDRLARMWWLLQFPAADREKYVAALEGLFNAADMNELVALYSALPVLPWPEEWKLRTAEGIRSNIGSVQSAIMQHNPYPAAWLDEPAWNQLVMKAIFTDNAVHLISGLDERANLSLAQILRDYAHERWAAGRTFTPQLWRLIGPFINEEFFKDILKVWNSENNIEKDAVALACAASDYAPAKELLSGNPKLQEEISSGQLTWNSVATRSLKDSINV